MSDWYRRTDWDEQIEVDFEARLARARPSSRAQYLSLQGYALIASRPEQAEALLQRAVDAEDQFETPRAACYLALSRVAQGKIDAAISAYDIAIEAERRNPAFRSSGGIDQALLIALHERRDRYHQALDQLALAMADDWSLAGLEALAAEAIIRNELGDRDDAQPKAQAALAQIPADATGLEWAGISFDDLRKRLEVIAR